MWPGLAMIALFAINHLQTPVIFLAVPFLVAGIIGGTYRWTILIVFLLGAVVVFAVIQFPGL